MASVLRLDWATHEAAKYACENWHYTKSLPPPPLVKIGVWENNTFVGVVIFGRGANNNLYRPFGLSGVEGAELVRVAMKSHQSAVSKVIAIAIRMLKKTNPGIKIVVSHADPAQGHIGAVYQAGNWVYTGRTAKDKAFIDKNGRRWHSRMISRSGVKKVYGIKRKVLRPSDCQEIELPGKYRYVYPLSNELKTVIEKMRKPYPKRAVSKENVATGFQSVEGGANPTTALQTEIT